MKIPTWTVIVSLILSGCATKSTAPNTDTSARIGEAVTAPLADLNLIRTKIPEALIEAKQDPYRHPADVTCPSIESEVAALNQALGPDLDIRRLVPEQDLLGKGGTLVGDSAIGALRDTTEGVIPFHGWVRKLTGAERHSKEVAGCIAAGIVRRAYLKGLGEAQGCEAPAAPLPAVPVVGRDTASMEQAVPAADSPDQDRP